MVQYYSTVLEVRIGPLADLLSDFLEEQQQTSEREPCSLLSVSQGTSFAAPLLLLQLVRFDT
jgi:hypothetical protein